LWPAERFDKLPYGVIPRKLWFLDDNGGLKKTWEKYWQDTNYDNGSIPGSLWYHIDWLMPRPNLYKFWEPESAYNDNWGNRDFYLMRLGEAYLIAAEAYLKAGNISEAVNRINTIRRRAAGGNSYMDITGADLSIDFILDERTRELVGEENRWTELKRTGKLIERTLKYNWWANSPYIPGGQPYLSEHHMLRPLPYSWWSLLANKEEVLQNPGYK
jgi:hypothetical protein